MKRTTTPNVPQTNKSLSTIQFSSNLTPSPIPSPISSPISSPIPSPIPSPTPSPISSPISSPIQQYHKQLPKPPIFYPQVIQSQEHPPSIPIITPQPYIYQPLEPIQNQELQPRQMVPVKINKKIKKTIHNKYKLGKQKNKQIPRVGILLKTPNTRKTIIEECKKLKSEDISQIKSYLRKRGFIKEGSIAPSNVIRELYCSLKTTGDVKNSNKEYTMDDLHSVDK